MAETIVDLDGRLAIASPITMTDRPEKHIHYYPTGVRTRDYPHLVGEGVEYDSWRKAYYIPSRGTYIRGADGADTLPIKHEVVAIPPPSRGGRDWRWQWYGDRWIKVGR